MSMLPTLLVKQASLTSLFDFSLCWDVNNFIGSKTNCSCWVVKCWWSKCLLLFENDAILNYSRKMNKHLLQDASWRHFGSEIRIKECCIFYLKTVGSTTRTNIKMRLKQYKFTSCCFFSTKLQAGFNLWLTESVTEELWTQMSYICYRIVC